MTIQRVVPAILTDKIEDLERMVRQAELFTQWVQFDIMDGMFVPSHSVGIDDIAGLKPQFEWEAHLMVHNTSNFVDGFQLAGASKIIIHYESIANPVDKIKYIQSLGMKAGLALNPDTPVSVINRAISENVESVLFMSVYPGYYGKPFLPEVLTKIKELRCKYPKISIGIDGGIKNENIKAVAHAGADEICVGSAIFASPNPTEKYNTLLELAEEGWQERLN